MDELTDEMYEAWQVLARSKLSFTEIRKLVFTRDYLMLRRTNPERMLNHIHMDIRQRYKFLCNDITEDWIARIINE